MALGNAMAGMARRVRQHGMLERYERAIRRGAPRKPRTADRRVLLDTAGGSAHAGDAIIMHFCERQLASIWPGVDFRRYPTHVPPRHVDPRSSDTLKILCGTNAIVTAAEDLCWIELARDPGIYAKSVLTLAVGIGIMPSAEAITPRTAQLLRYLFADGYLHSVRDSNTERQLRAVGIDNVVNTACVTMWDLTEARCAAIPRGKAREVLTTITDYRFDPDRDGYMLDRLKRHYDKVHLWVQGSRDLERLRGLPQADGVELVRGGFPGLEAFVAQGRDLDYFGTRLHCGIYCMNHGIRSMIVSVDNRAADIERDTNLPVVERTALKGSMERLIEEDRDTAIRLPQANIDRWKRQFAD